MEVPVEVQAVEIAKALKRSGASKDTAQQVLPYALAVFERSAVEPISSAAQRAVNTALDVYTAPESATEIVTNGVTRRISPILGQVIRLGFRYGPAIIGAIGTAWAADQVVEYFDGDNAAPEGQQGNPPAGGGGSPSIPSGDPFDMTPPGGGGSAMPVPPNGGGTVTIPGGGGYNMPTPVPGGNMQLAGMILQLAIPAGQAWRNGDPDVREAVRILAGQTLGGGRIPTSWDRCGYAARHFAKKRPSVVLALAEYQCGIDQPLDLDAEGKAAWVVLEMLMSGVDFNSIATECGCR